MNEEAALRYVPWEGGQAGPQIGLHPLDPAEWIEPDDHFVEQMSNKDVQLATNYDSVVRDLPETTAAQSEVVDLLVAQLPERYPDIWDHRGDEIIIRPTGRRYDRARFAGPPIDLAGRLVQEDLCLMRESPAGYTLVAASVCAPSYWSLAQKIGRPMRAIHAPVPEYGERLGSRVDRVLQNLKAHQPVWRLNWSLPTSPALFCPGATRDRNEEPLTTETVATQVFVRIERQTLRRLAKSGDILFTIKTYIDPLGAIAGSPAIAADLAQAVERLDARYINYKAISPFKEPLLEWLRTVSASNWAKPSSLPPLP